MARPGARVPDGTAGKRWRAPADVKSAWFEVDLGQPIAIAGFGFDEPDVWPRLRQQFKLEVFEGAAWRTITQGKTSGHGAKEPLKPMTAQKFRLTMDCDKGSPGVAELQLYRAE